MRILVIEDDDQLRALVQSMLQLSGYETIVASNGREGLAAVNSAPVDLVITDLIMPEMEGLETIERLRKEFPKVRIIAMSGGLRHRSIDFLPVARRLGASEILLKPFDKQTLLDTVEKALRDPESPSPSK